MIQGLSPPQLVANSKSQDGSRLVSFEVQYRFALHAEVLSNRELSVSTHGGNNHSPLASVRALITSASWVDVFRKYGIGGGVFHEADYFFNTLSDAYRQAGDPKLLSEGAWHLPYIDQGTIEDACLFAAELAGPPGLTPEELDQKVTTLCVMLSTVRCHLMAGPGDAALALTLGEQLDIYDELSARFPLSSAFEHQAQPDTLWFDGGWRFPETHGNLPGWRQQKRLIATPVRLTSHNVTQERVRLHA